MQEYLIRWLSFYEKERQWSNSTFYTVNYWQKDFAKFFASHYPNLQLQNITTQHLQQYRQSMAHLATSTQSRRFGLVRLFFAWCVKQNLILRSPAVDWGKIKVIQARRTALSLEEIKTVLQTIDTTSIIGCQLRTIIELVYSTGIRRRELLALDINDVDIATKRLVIRYGKGNKKRIVPLLPNSRQWLQYHLQNIRPKLAKNPRCQALFLNRFGLRLPCECLNVWIYKLRQQSKIAKLTLHVLRHTCATHLLRSDVPLPYIQKLLGHTDIGTTQNYLHLTTICCQKQYTSAHPRDKWDLK